MKKLILPLMLMMSLLVTSAVKDDIYPKPEKGMKKHVIQLEPKDKEEDYIVKIKFGKEKMVDCNKTSLSGGKIEEKNLSGYGYSYYVFSGSDNMISTQMLCTAQVKTKKDVFYNQEQAVRYNSKLPVVIYAPEDVFVNYNIYEKVVDKTLR